MHTTVIPVVMTVAPDFSDGMVVGGAVQADAESAQLYDNAVVRGACIGPCARRLQGAKLR